MISSVRLFQNIATDLKKHAAEAIRLESLALEIDSQTDIEFLVSALAQIRTRIAALLAQAENGRIAITVSE